MKKAVILLILTSMFMSCMEKNPIADFEVKNPTGKHPEGTFLFENKSINADKYFWEFGDDEVSNEVSPKHIYREKDMYMIVLTATKGNKQNQKIIYFSYE